MTQNKKPSLQIINVSKSYDTLKAVNNITFSAFPGEVIALLGPNGAGKTTLMNMIVGYLSSSEGEIFINGHNVTQDNLIIKKDIGFLSEGSPLYGDMSVSLFLKYFIELKLNIEESENLSKRKIKELYNDELNRILGLAHIEDVANQKIETLSKGYTRRVGFALSLIGNPPVLLLDEPTDGLDPNQKEYMIKLIQQMSKNKTILISTHLLDEVETIATKIILINKGKIVAGGSIKDILSAANKKNLKEAFITLTKGEYCE